jgi:hypothetical protein
LVVYFVTGDHLPHRPVTPVAIKWTQDSCIINFSTWTPCPALLHTNRIATPLWRHFFLVPTLGLGAEDVFANQVGACHHEGRLPDAKENARHDTLGSGASSTEGEQGKSRLTSGQPGEQVPWRFAAAGASNPPAYLKEAAKAV